MDNKIADIPSWRAEDTITEKRHTNLQHYDVKHTNLQHYNTDKQARSASDREELVDLPMYSITWVENEKSLVFGIDYLALTIYCSLELARELYKKYFENLLGALEEKNGSRFYEIQFTAAGGFYLQAQHRIANKQEHVRMIFPGQACEYIPFQTIKEFIRIEANDIKINCTRIDLKIDNCPFKPFQIANDIQEGKAKTWADISTIKRYDEPLGKNELGDIGTQGMYLGSRTSDRYLRIYDLHGFTRFELECKEEYADSYFKILIKSENKFCDSIMGFCMDFITMDTDYWKEFTEGYTRANYKRKVYQDKTLFALRKYLLKQVSIIFSIIYDIEGDKIVYDMLDRGREARRGNAKYANIIHRYDIE